MPNNDNNNNGFDFWSNLMKVLKALQEMYIGSSTATVATIGLFNVLRYITGYSTVKQTLTGLGLLVLTVIFVEAYKAYDRWVHKNDKQ